MTCFMLKRSKWWTAEPKGKHIFTVTSEQALYPQSNGSQGEAGSQ